MMTCLYGTVQMLTCWFTSGNPSLVSILFKAYKGHAHLVLLLTTSKSSLEVDRLAYSLQILQATFYNLLPADQASKSFFFFFTFPLPD